MNEKTLLGSGTDGYIRQNNKAVCFQDVPLYSLAENLAYEDEVRKKCATIENKVKSRYEAFGLRFNKGILFQKGARPVIYGTKSELDNLPSDVQWRCVQLDLTNSNSIVDWTHEREWRIAGDLQFEYNEIEVIVNDAMSYQKFIEHYSGHQLLGEINGIIVLNSLFR